MKSAFEKYGNLLLLGSSLVFAGIFAVPLLDLMRFSTGPANSKYNSYIVLIPIVAALLLYNERDGILAQRKGPAFAGLPIILAGILIYLAGTRARDVLNETDYLSLVTFAVVLTLIGVFLLHFGAQSFRHARFPLLFLFFLIPIPSLVKDKALHFLQMAATETSFLLFNLTGVTFFRDGTLFQFPGLSIVIAPECSGMRSTVTLFIVSVLAGHLFLETYWRKVVLMAATVPVTVLGNAVRIVGLTLIAMYITPSVMDTRSALHERGGLAFFVVDLIVLGILLSWLRRREASTLDKQQQRSVPGNTQNG